MQCASAESVLGRRSSGSCAHTRMRACRFGFKGCETMARTLRGSACDPIPSFTGTAPEMTAASGKCISNTPRLATHTASPNSESHTELRGNRGAAPGAPRLQLLRHDGSGFGYALSPRHAQELSPRGHGSPRSQPLTPMLMRHDSNGFGYALSPRPEPFQALALELSPRGTFSPRLALEPSPRGHGSPRSQPLPAANQPPRPVGTEGHWQEQALKCPSLQPLAPLPGMPSSKSLFSPRSRPLSAANEQTKVVPFSSPS